MENLTSKRKIKKDAFRLISGKDNEMKALQEVLSLLGMKHKHSLTRRKKFSPAEQKEVEKNFSEYGVNVNIWDDEAK